MLLDGIKLTEKKRPVIGHLVSLKFDDNIEQELSLAIGSS
jgi:hypothetical protein